MPYAIQVTAVEPTRHEAKSLAEKRNQAGTHVNGLDAAEAPREQWSAPLFGCFSSCVPNCCLVAFCPCISLAQIDARLGGSFDMAVMGFGMLVTGLLVCGGLLASSIQGSHYTGETDPEFGMHSAPIDGYYHPPKRSVSTAMVVVAAVVVALVLVLAIVRLRHKTRRQSALTGSAAQDLALTLACCPCVVAQMATQLDTYTPGVCSLAPALEYKRHRQRERDVLPAYMITLHA